MQFELEQARRGIDDAVNDFLHEVASPEEFAAEWVLIGRGGQDVKKIHIITSDNTGRSMVNDETSVRDLVRDAIKVLKL